MRSPAPRPGRGARSHLGSVARVGGALLCTLTICAPFALARPAGAATTVACSETAIQSALDAGGNYTFAGSCTLSLQSPLTMAGGTVTLDANANAVTLDGGNAIQLLSVSAGSLTLTGITLIGGQATGSNGVDGTPAPTGSGDGTGGGIGLTGQGGAISIEGGATVNLVNDVVTDNSAQGGSGGSGGHGGYVSSTDCGGGGGNGGLGGGGGAAQGGAIYNAGTLVVSSTTFSSNFAYGGDGGGGGWGGDGEGGGSGGHGANGGNGGDAQGGTIYNAGSLTISSSSFSGGSAHGGSAGGGAVGGYAGGGISCTAQPGAGGPGGQGGNGGNGQGGAIYDVGTLSISSTTFDGLSAVGGSGGPGAEGGVGSTNGTNGIGGNGGNAMHGALFSSGSIPGAGFCTNSVTGGAAGLGFGTTNGSVGTATDPDSGSACAPPGAPVIDSIEPAGGPLGGQNLVKIIGSGFQGTGLTLSGVTFSAGLDTLAGINPVVVSDTEIDVTAPDATNAPLVGSSIMAGVQASFDDATTNSTLDSVPAKSGANNYLFGAPVAPQCNALDACQAVQNLDPNADASASSTATNGTMKAVGQGVGGLTIGRYPSDPETTGAFSSGGTYFDVRVSNPNSFSTVTITDCALSGATTLRWWNGVGWQAVAPQAEPIGAPPCLIATLNTTTSSPTIAELTGTVFASGTPTPRPGPGAGPSTATTISLASSANPAGVGREVAYTATVSPPPDAGTVAFSDGGAGVAGCGAVPVESGNGVAVCDPAYATPGTHTITATYSGDGTFAPSTSSALTQVVASVTRTFGQDAIGTAIAISQASYPITGSAGAVVLARSDFFSDALAGGPLAAMLHAPLLLTPGATMLQNVDPRVLQEIERVLPAGGTVYVLGGDQALSPAIDSTLESLGYGVVREAGANEDATACDIAGALGDPTTVFEVTGLSFYDSVSAVPAAIATHGAILLTDGTTQAPETAAYLAAHPSDTRIAIGGPLAAAGADPSATAVYGADAYGTSAAVASRFFPAPQRFGAATSAWFSDALAAGPALGEEGAPMLLVAPSGPLPVAVARYLASVAGTLTGGTLYGGPLAVGDDVLSELEATL